MNDLTKTSVFIILFFSLFLSDYNLKAQTYPCFLYGSIKTVDGNMYEGSIRWNNEEVFLTDMFNSEKIENPYMKYLDDQPKTVEYKRKNRTSWYRIEYPNNGQYGSKSTYARKFECRFGDINSISVTGSESVNLELKTGKFINLKGGSNDLGTQIWIKDHELGLVKIDWNRIDVVHFFRPEKEVVENFGDPIYGKITTTIGEFTGFIQWDHDERLLQDHLDGSSNDGKLSIPFTKIRKIQKAEQGSVVTLQSNRELNLSSSNDVTHTNRGIVVTIPQVGSIDFTWKHFLSLEIIPLPTESVSCFSEFVESKRLYGRLSTKQNKIFEGIIVYDMDEAMDAEILNGLNDKLSFSIPFRNVKKITPKSYSYCLVELKNGQQLFLGDQTDVSGRNSGVIIFTESDKYEVVAWEDINEIEFR